MEEGEEQEFIPQNPQSSKSWSIHSRREITSKYQILECIGSGAYSDVYRAVRRSDSAVVALKEVHDYQSAFREIEALQILRNDPNVITLHEYFFSDDEDAVLVLEYLPTDLTSVIKAAKKEWDGGMRIGELKRWMIQVLRGVDACHRNWVVHRDLKPSNLLISEDGLLKIADFGQARILDAPGFSGEDNHHLDEQHLSNNQPVEIPVPGNQFIHKQTELGKKEDELTTDEASNYIVEGDTLSHDGANSCLATCYTSDLEEDPYQHSYSYEAEETRTNGIVPLTSCVGTRWFRAPELLYGSTNYGLEIDLWSLGCIFAELLTLEPIFPGNSDIDQLGKIFSTLGNLTEEICPRCVELPDYKIISFARVEKPIGLDTCLSNRSLDEIRIVKKLLCYDPAVRASAIELLNDKYFFEEPLPVALSELRIPAKCGNSEDFDVDGNSFKWNDGDSDSDFDEFVSSNIITTKNGFSIRFS